MLADLGTIKTEFVLKTSKGVEVEVFETPEAAQEWNDKRTKAITARGGVVPSVHLVRRVITEEEFLV
ncbi:hypothetical protein [Caballeronia sp. LZ034LL]|uniref:hypothetical protein n=1 Tax=Caballeronia sp. LZ034LL TaxID=3038567 RepID=UPI00285F2A43|nr:hypothetical protein [Caballeronia sp. LZ034LL]MDR5839348.1 hypothetical protein [Caballeronia sp. LZ034LL]